MSDIVNDFDVLTRFLRYSPEEAQDIISKVSEVRVEEMKKKYYPESNPPEPEVR